MFLRIDSKFILVSIVVDDMVFESNSLDLLNSFKEKITQTFDVKLFGELKKFIGWEIRRGPFGISI